MFTAVANLSRVFFPSPLTTHILVGTGWFLRVDGDTIIARMNGKIFHVAGVSTVNELVQRERIWAGEVIAGSSEAQESVYS